MLDLDDAAAVARELAAELGDMRPEFTRLGRYYDGDHPLPCEPARLTAKHRELLAESVSNWCALVVDVVAERLSVEGIRASGSPDFDDRAWRWWQCNKMDARSALVHTETLKLGVCYAGVWPGKVWPRISPESPLQVHVRYDAITGEPVAAIKVWQESTPLQDARMRSPRLLCTLYTPQAVYRFRSGAPSPRSSVYEARQDVTEPLSGIRWVPRDPGDDGGPVLRNPLGQVPFVAFRNRPDLLGGYESEMAGILPIQDRINRTIFHRLLTQEFQAAPQRWVVGLDLEEGEDGEPKEPYDSAVDRLWTATDPDTKFGQFPAATTGDLQQSVIQDVQALSTQSRTPPHYLMAGMGVFPSGESLRASEYGLSRKVTDRQQNYGESWETVIRLAARAAGDPALARDEQMEISWRQVEARSEGELVDALLKMSTLGVPRQVLWERWGASPQDIERWEALARAEADLDAGIVTDPGTGMSYGHAGPPGVRIGADGRVRVSVRPGADAADAGSGAG